MGDTMITLPYLQALRQSLPDGVRLDLLTREEVDPIPRNIHLFDKVYSIGGERNLKKNFLSALLMLPRLWLRRYEVIIDLQNNIVTRTIRKALRPAAWSEFDRFSPIAAGERTRLTIQAAGLDANRILSPFRLKDPELGALLLHKNGWNGKDPLIVLNPAGVFVTRNWPLENYIQFARLWQQRLPETKFVILGTSLIAKAAAILKKELGKGLIDLVGQTTPLEAFAVLQETQLVVSEDSGLMHMAWVSGRPTLVLFGGTRSDWSRPLGKHTMFFDSSDLACGSCMQETCHFGDVHCLTRYTPEKIFQAAWDLSFSYAGTEESE
jgi:ADP-heptose:LPS heptosyltransferase